MEKDKGKWMKMKFLCLIFLNKYCDKKLQLLLFMLEIIDVKPAYWLFFN